MTTPAKPVSALSDDGKLMFYCPGCRCHHGCNVRGPRQPRWSWNQSVERPSLNPSVLHTTEPRCHLFLINGEIHFLDDCDHAFAGKMVELEEP